MVLRDIDKSGIAMGEYWSRANQKGALNSNNKTTKNNNNNQDSTFTTSTIMDLPSCELKSLRFDNTKLEPIENSSVFMYRKENVTTTVLDDATSKLAKSADSGSFVKDLPSVSLKSLDIKMSRLEPIQSESRFMYQQNPKTMFGPDTKKINYSSFITPLKAKKHIRSPTPCLTKVGKLFIPNSKFADSSTLKLKKGSKTGLVIKKLSPLSKIGIIGKTPKKSLQGKKPGTPLKGKLKSPLSKKSIIKKERPKTPINTADKEQVVWRTLTQSKVPPPPTTLIKRPKDNN